MWKKFTDLLFEDDENVEEEYVEEQKIEKPKKVVKPVIENEVRPVKEVKPIQIDEVEVKKVEQPSVFVEPKPKPSISMVVDDLQEVKPEVKKPEPIKERPRVVPINKPDPRNTYEFSPVISPIFGISEKDMDTVTPTSPNKKKAVSDNKMGTVISPMYGLYRETPEEPTHVKTTTTETFVEEIEAEEEVPNFSLDDILARRTVEDTSNMEKTKFFKSSISEEELDKTIVLTNHNMSLFDEDDE